MAEKRATPQLGTMGKTYVTHGPQFSLKDLAAHANMRPEDARRILRELVDSIPEADLHNFAAAQLTVVT